MIRQGAGSQSGQIRGKKQEPWQHFEQEVAELVESLDSGAIVEPDAHMTGLVSGVTRYLDALVRGQVVGQDITIAIEAKRYKRPVSIGTIDEFVGKLLDVGCDRGVLYAAGGFSEAALSRASNARNPGIGIAAAYCPSCSSWVAGVHRGLADSLVSPYWLSRAAGGARCRQGKKPVPDRAGFAGPVDTNSERSVRLIVEIAHGLTTRSRRWRDRKNRSLEQALGVILAEIEERAVEDVKHNDEHKRRECESRWRAAVEEAKKLALREQLAAGLRDEAARRSPRRRR